MSAEASLKSSLHPHLHSTSLSNMVHGDDSPSSSAPPTPFLASHDSKLDSEMLLNSMESRLALDETMEGIVEGTAITTNAEMSQSNTASPVLLPSDAQEIVEGFALCHTPPRDGDIPMEVLGRDGVAEAVPACSDIIEGIATGDGAFNERCSDVEAEIVEGKAMGNDVKSSSGVGDVVDGMAVDGAVDGMAVDSVVDGTAVAGGRGVEGTPVAGDGVVEGTPVAGDGVVEGTPVAGDGVVEGTPVAGDGVVEGTPVAGDGVVEGKAVSGDNIVEAGAICGGVIDGVVEGTAVKNGTVDALRSEAITNPDSEKPFAATLVEGGLVSSENEPTLPCPKCSKVFFHETSLKAHARVHDM